MRIIWKTFAGGAMLLASPRVIPCVMPLLALLSAILGSSASMAIEAPVSAWNPRPAAGDIVIPMPASLGMVFRRIPVPGAGHWGRLERIFEIGTEGQPFETTQKVRIGGSFRDGRKWYNVFAKYEVSVAQYAAVMGQGDLASGIRYLGEHVGGNAKADYLQLLSGDANAALVNQKLSLPVAGLTTKDYDDFIEAYNDWCMVTPACTNAIENNFQNNAQNNYRVLGFFRLPTEIEWEYAARGGGEAAAAFEQPGTPAEEKARREFRQPLPVNEADLPKFARIGEINGAPAPIGSFQPLFGLHDLYGNVAELTAGPFAMDQFSSRIGGRVARGGSYVKSAADVRASLREEVAPFRRDEDGRIVRARPDTVGIRLVVGSIVMDRRDRPTIEREFTDDYISTVSTDLAGNTEETARDVGRVDGTTRRDVLLEDFIGGDDLLDYFKFRTTQYGQLRIEAKSIVGRAAMEVRSGSRTQHADFAPGQNGVAVLDKLVPGQVFVKFEVPRGSPVGRYQATATLNVDDPAGDTLAGAFNLGPLTDRETIERKDYVGGDDLADVWKFQLNEADTVEVQLDELTESLDVDLRDSSDRVLGSARQSGTMPKKFATPRLERGTYYIRVVPADRERGSTYTLRVAKGSIDTAGDTPATARDLGALGPGGLGIPEHVGGPDRGDVFKFTAQEQMRLQLTVSNMTSNVTLDLLNDSEQAVASSHRGGTENIDVIVQARSTYYIAIKPAGDSTAYSLDILLSRIAPFSLPVVAAQTTIGVAASTLTHTLTPANVQYYARFTLRESTPVSIDLTWSEPQTDLDLFLLKEDLEKIASSTKDPPVITESISPDMLPGGVLAAGTYYVRVARMAGSSPATPFTLTLRGAALHSSKEQAAPLSVTGATATYTLPANVNEYWGRFSVSERSKVTIVLNWNDSDIDLDMELKDDRDRDVDSSRTTTTTEKIDKILDAGSYLIRIYRDRPTGMGAVPLRLSVTRSAVPVVSWTAYENVDIEKGDFVDLLQGLKPIDETTCHQRCLERLPTCLGYSYNRWTSACYLKQTLDGTFRRKDPSLRSVLRRDLPLPAWYPKPETVTNTSREFRGSELRRETRANREQCRTSCAGENRCVGYTFAPPSTCVLFERIDSATDRPGTQSGLKQQEAP